MKLWLVVGVAVKGISIREEGIIFNSEIIRNAQPCGGASNALACQELNGKPDVQWNVRADTILRIRLSKNIL